MQEAQGAPSPQVRQLLAVIYAFEVVQDGERSLVTQDRLPASELFLLQQQLEAAPKRTLVAFGPGLLVYSNFQHARFAAQTIATVADVVTLREVVAGEESGADGVWTAANGGRYSAVPGGVRETIKD